MLDIFEVFREYFISEPVQIDSLPHGFLDTCGSLLDFLVLDDDVLLDFVHFFAVGLDCSEFVVGGAKCDVVENLQDLLVLILNIDKSQLLPFILANESR